MAHLRAGPAGSGWCRYRAGAHHLAALVALLATSCAAATTGPVAIRVLPPEPQLAAFVPAYREPPPPPSVVPPVVLPAAQPATTWVPHPSPAAASRGARRVPRETAPPPTAPAPAGGLPAGLVCIRQRESGGNYSDNTGNGYYGAYQFSSSTWRSMGTGYPRADLAPPEVQDDAAARLQRRSGWGQWPESSRLCGLR